MVEMVILWPQGTMAHSMIIYLTFKNIQYFNLVQEHGNSGAHGQIVIDHVMMGYVSGQGLHNISREWIR